MDGDDTLESLRDQIRSVVSRVTRIEPALLTDSVSLRRELWVDSVQAAQIVAVLEKTFGIIIDEVEILNVDTVTEIADLVREYQGKGGPAA